MSLSEISHKQFIFGIAKRRKVPAGIFGEEIGNVFRVSSAKEKNPNHHHWNVLEIRTTREEKKVLKHLSGFSHSLAGAVEFTGGKVDSLADRISFSAFD